MEISGLNKVFDSLGEAFSVFDFSFFISGAVTLGFIALDLHYYGHNGILHLEGWLGVVIYILAIYVSGLMSWSIGKLMRWSILKLVWWKKGGVAGDFKKRFDDNVQAYKTVATTAANNMKNEVKYAEMWVEIEKKTDMSSRMNILNKAWVMVALFEGLSFSWVVGLFVYLDGWLVGKWLESSCWIWNVISCGILLGLTAVSLHRATKYSQDLIKDVIAAYYMK